MEVHHHAQLTHPLLASCAWLVLLMSSVIYVSPMLTTRATYISNNLASGIHMVHAKYPVLLVSCAAYPKEGVNPPTYVVFLLVILKSQSS